MWILLFYLKLGAFYSAVCFSQATPSNVHFSSINLRNVLHWHPGNGTTEDVLFTAQYAIYGDSVDNGRGRRTYWRAVQHCTEILQNWCDLTKETWDMELWYHARVRAKTKEASSKWVTTRKRFDPKLDTIFGPPSVIVDMQNNTEVITLKGPMRYQPNNKTPLVSMASLYPSMRYDLSINNTHQNKNDVFFAVSSPLKYQQMEPNTKFCFSAKASFLSIPVVSQSSPWCCFTTPPDPAMQLLKVVAGFISATLLICVLIVAAFFFFQYLLGRGQKRPTILDGFPTDYFSTTFPTEKPNINTINEMKDEVPSDFTFPGAYQAQSNPALAVADQEPSNHSWIGGTHLVPEQGGLSVDYGTVSVVPRGGLEMAREFEENDQINPPLLMSSNRIDCRFLTQHVASSRMMSYFPQQSKQVHSQIYSRKSMSTLVQTQQLELLHENKTWWLYFTGAGVEKEPVAESLVAIPSQREGSDCEEKPFLPEYASQSLDRPSFQFCQSECSDDYGFVMTSSQTEDQEGGSIIDWDPETKRLMLPVLREAFHHHKGWETTERGSDKRMQRELLNEM